jgi:hypothetical protein
MWFPKDSEGPISLLELGRWLCSSKPICVGVEKGYPRETELRTTIECIRPGLPVSTDLAQHARLVAAWLVGNEYNRLQASPESTTEHHRIYLSGGIRNCPDWQSELVQLLWGIPDISVENPRRAHFTPQGSEDYKEMVEHNRQNFDRCGAIVFWFPKGMLTPVALCELGSVLTKQKPIFIGVEPGYKRAIDVEIQTHLERPEVSIAGSLEQLACQVRDYYASIAR